MWIRLNDIMIQSDVVQMIERNDAEVDLTKKDGSHMRVAFPCVDDAVSACVEAYDRLKMEDNGKVLELRRQRYGELAVKDVITDTRTLNILKRMKIGKVSEMAVLSEEELKKIPWCGKHVIGNIKNALERAGMKLRAS